jgi:hypothetical protein
LIAEADIDLVFNEAVIAELAKDIEATPDAVARFGDNIRCAVRAYLAEHARLIDPATRNWLERCARRPLSFPSSSEILDRRTQKQAHLPSKARFRCGVEGPDQFDVWFESIMEKMFGDSEYKQWVKRLHELGLSPRLPDQWK